MLYLHPVHLLFQVSDDIMREWWLLCGEVPVLDVQWEGTVIRGEGDSAWRLLVICPDAGDSFNIAVCLIPTSTSVTRIPQATAAQPTHQG